MCVCVCVCVYAVARVRVCVYVCARVYVCVSVRDLNKRRLVYHRSQYTVNTNNALLGRIKGPWFSTDMISYLNLFFKEMFYLCKS